MTKSVLTVVISVIILAVASWWIGYGRDDQHVTDTSNNSGLPPPIQEPEILPDEDASNYGLKIEEPQPVSFAKTIVHVPAGTVKPPSAESFDDLVSVTAENLNEFTIENMAAALDGDLESGYRVAQARQRCRGAAKNIQELDRKIEERMRMVQYHLDNGRPIHTGEFDRPGNLFLTEAENRTHQARWYETCRLQRELFNEELRKKLDAMARQGHVIARYLYAVWPPDQLDSPDQFMLEQEWGIKAQEYSFLNFQQGEVAGLLAFAEAYMTSGLFTRHNNLLGLALYKAAYDCGFTEGMAKMAAEDILKSEKLQPKIASRTPQILVMAENLSEYCR